jgi:hypothetical protein
LSTSATADRPGNGQEPAVLGAAAGLGATLAQAVRAESQACCVTPGGGVDMSR